jgi:hypothetical protein
LSQARYDLAAASVVGGVVMFSGGWNGSLYSAIIDVCNATNDNRFTLSMTQPPYSLATATISSTNSIILFGSEMSNSGLSNVVDIFDIPAISLPQQSQTPRLEHQTSSPSAQSSSKSLALTSSCRHVRKQ